MRFYNFALAMGLLALASVDAYAFDSVTFSASGKIVAKTCSFESKDVVFNLGDVRNTTFSGIGTASPWVEQSLVSTGCGADVASIEIRFAGTADTDYPNYFAATGGAQGVAVHLHTDSAGDAIPNDTTPHVWAPQGNGGKYTYKARYVQTKQDIVAGGANATIIVALSYL